MKTRPITPARIDWSGAVPSAPDFGDVYHPRVGAFEQARHVFLRGNGLPERWRGRERFTILETGFGLGLNFLATWQAWRNDPARCRRLHYVSIERHPPVAADLARAHDMVAQDPVGPVAELAAELHRRWPPLTPNLHALELDDGRVQLLLGFGDVADLLPALRCAADAVFLDGFAPGCNPAMWSLPVLKAVGRLAVPGATAATWSVAREVRDGLATAGFEIERAEGIGGKRETTRARCVPRPGTPARPSTVVGTADALVIGAGIAGAAVARALQREGCTVSVVDRHPAPATEASGNPGGLVHGILHPDDGPHARLLRGAALLAPSEYGALIDRGTVEGALRGLLWVDARAGGLPALQARWAASGLPPDYVHPLAATEAAAAAGVPLAAPAWRYPGGGWVAPAAAVRAWLEGLPFRGGLEVARLERSGGRWLALDAGGRIGGAASIVVLANGPQAARLLAPLGHGPWPTTLTRGQVSVHAAPAPTSLRLPLTGDGYTLPLADGRLLCGATRERVDAPTDMSARPAAHTALRAEDHLWNAERARRLTGLDLPLDPAAWQGRAGLRLHAADRLPIAGALARPKERSTQARWLEREPGLFVLAALGARGLTLAPLLGRLVAAMACGTPWPLEQDLVDAIDPGRWQVRAARRGT